MKFEISKAYSEAIHHWMANNNSETLKFRVRLIQIPDLGLHLKVSTVAGKFSFYSTVSVWTCSMNLKPEFCSHS